jgi:hypothetical protein
MRFKPIPLFALLFILIVGLGFTQVSTGSVSYEREDKAVISDAFGTVAHVDLTNKYTKIGSEMYLQDCGLTTCYLTLTITPDSPLDARTIIGRVAGGAASYKGLEIYETRIISVPHNTYKTITENYTQYNNVSGKNETIFYNRTVPDKTVYVDTPITDWYPMNYSLMNAGTTYTLRLEYKKNALAKADLIPEINGIKVEGWAWWNTTWGYATPCVINTTVASALTNFPAYCVLDTATLISAGKMNATCGDLRPLDSTNTTELLYEIEANTCNTTNSTIWIGLNTSAAAKDTIWLYYGNLPATTTQNPIGLWRNATYVGVFHFANESGVYRDSAGYNNLTATIVGSGVVKDITPTNLGPGVSIEGFSTSNQARLNSSATTTGLPSGNNSFTLSWWAMKQTNNGADGGSWIRIGTYAANNCVYISQRTISPYYLRMGGYSLVPQGANYPAYNIYHHYAVNYSLGTNETTWKNGSIVNAVLGVDLTSLDNGKIELGGDTISTSDYNNISYTELRIRNITSSADWISAEYNLLYEIGAETTPTTNNAPVLQSISLNPAIIHKNTSVWCEVNFTDDSNTTFTAKQGLAINGTIIDVFNHTEAAYTNATIWNVSYSVINYTHGDKVSCWAFATDTDTTPLSSSINYTSNITISNYAPVISNVQITNPILNGSNTTGTATFTDYENDTINCRFEWFNNGTNIYNHSQSPCTNTSTLFYINYTVGDLINFTVYANDSLGQNATPASSATVEVAATFTIISNTYNATQYESLYYPYNISFVVPPGSYATYEIFHIHGTDLTPTCTNVSTSYNCSISVPAPLTATNSTPETAYWLLNYTDGITEIEANESFTITILYAVWPTNITSTKLAAMGTPIILNVSYENVSGITATISGSGAFTSLTEQPLTCTNGICAGTFTAPTVGTTTLLQSSANITLTSSYWSTSETRPVSITNTYRATASNSINTTSGTITNPGNAYDLVWGGTSYATLNDGAYITFNYSSISQIYNITNWTVKDAGGTRQLAPGFECWNTLSFRIKRSGTTFVYSCYNSTSENYSTISTVSPGTYLFYEQNITYTQSNSYSVVVPYGITNCTSGTPIATYYVRDEDTNALIVANYTQKFFLLVGNSTYGYQFTGQDDTWNICVYPTGINATYTALGQYSAGGYGSRAYAITSPASTLIVSNYTRYLGLGSTDYTFTVKDNFGLEISNVSAIMYKFNFITNQYEVVGSGLTDYTGTIVFYMKPLDTYRFNFTKSGYEPLEFDLVPSGLTSITVVLDSAGTQTLQLPNFYYKWNDVYYYLSPNVSVGTNATNITFDIVSNTSTLDYYGMEIKKVVNGTTTTVFSQQINASPSGGTLQYEANDSGQYYIDVWFKDANYSEYSPFTKTFTLTSKSGFLMIRDKLQTNPPISGWTFYFIGVICAMVAGGYAARYTRVGAGIVGILVLAGFTFMWPNAELVCMSGAGGTCITATHATILAFIGVLAAIFISNNQYG